MPATCQSTLAQSMLPCLQSPSELVSRAGKQLLHSCQDVLCLSTGSTPPPAQEQASLILLPGCRQHAEVPCQGVQAGLPCSLSI